MELKNTRSTQLKSKGLLGQKVYPFKAIKCKTGLPVNRNLGTPCLPLVVNGDLWTPGLLIYDNGEPWTLGLPTDGNEVIRTPGLPASKPVGV